MITVITIEDNPVNGVVYNKHTSGEPTDNSLAQDLGEFLTKAATAYLATLGMTRAETKAYIDAHRISVN